MKGQSISGAYMKENDGVYKHVKSLHLNGKFQTEFKQASLPGWYDQINPKQYVKRDEVSQDSFIFFCSGSGGTITTFFRLFYTEMRLAF